MPRRVRRELTQAGVIDGAVWPPRTNAAGKRAQRLTSRLLVARNCILRLRLATRMSLTLGVSPWVQPGSVSNTVYDHTTLLATILRRVCVRADGSVPSMGARTDKANDVSALLTAPTAVAPPISPGIPGVVLASPPATPRPDRFGCVLRTAQFASFY